MLSYIESSKRLVCVAPPDTAITVQLILVILIYLRVPEYLLHYACSGVCVCARVRACVCVRAV